MGLDLYADSNYSGDSVKKEAPKHENRLKTGDIVQCIIYQKTYINRLMKELDKKNQAYEKKCEAGGIDFTPEPYSYFKCGLAYNCAVVRRATQFSEIGEVTEWEPFFAETCIAPFNVKFQLQQPTPGQMYYGKGFGTAKYRTGWCNKTKNNMPEIESNMFPSTYPVKDWDSGTVVTELKESQREQFADLIEKEAARVSAWETLINSFGELDEKQMKAWLDSKLARRMMFLKESFNEYGYDFIMPTVGLRFQGKVVSWNDNEYFDVIGCEINKVEGKWITYNYQSALSEPTDKEIELAIMTFEMLEEQAAKQEEDNKAGF